MFASPTIKPVELKRILLEYNNGTTLVVPETKTREVGTAFMKAINNQQLEWEIIEKKKGNFLNRLVEFFKI